jgi:hypothetical protein
MGQISGVNAQSITNIAGVQVASISYVGPITASALGLGGGGGGFVFTVQNWGEPLDACTNGATSISDKGSQTLYLNTENNTFYTDSTFVNQFNGEGAWWWCQTNNISYVISEKGDVKNTSACSVVTGLVFTVYGIQGEEGFFESCVDGQNSINKYGSQLLYQNGEMFYVDAEYTTPFNGMDTWWWCQTNNTSYRIGMEGNTMNINPCG